jgi:hypothetical protein
MGQFLWSGVSARPWNVAADRFARKIVRFLMLFLIARLRLLNGNPFGGLISTLPNLVRLFVISHDEKAPFAYCAFRA